MGGATSFKPCMLISSPFPPLPSPPLPYPPHPSLHFLPLPSRPGWRDPNPLTFPSPPPGEGVPPLNQLGGLGSPISSPSGVWGKAPADKQFDAYLGQKEQLWWQQFLCIS